MFKGGKVSIINLYDEQERSLYSDFVASAAYLKAKCYDILPFYPKKFADSKYKVEKVAFNIKLNIPVTNSIVAGLQVIELLKLCQVIEVLLIFSYICDRIKCQILTRTSI